MRASDKEVAPQVLDRYRWEVVGAKGETVAETPLQAGYQRTTRNTLRRVALQQASAVASTRAACNDLGP
jgi:hypothetical protein